MVSLLDQERCLGKVIFKSDGLKKAIFKPPFEETDARGVSGERPFRESVYLIIVDLHDLSSALTLILSRHV